MSVIRLSKLSDDSEWQALHRSIDPKRDNLAVLTVLGQLRAGGAVSVLVEDEYLDQDFSASYSAFYSTVFKRHTKLCRRLHFFKEDITSGDTINDIEATATSTKLEEVGQRGYLGFIVTRPLSHAPLGRVVLCAPPSPAHMRSILLVQAPYEAHVLGASLPVRAIALTQQDSRVGACAQAAIWMAGRHFHMRHRGPWFSTVAITELRPN